MVVLTKGRACIARKTLTSSATCHRLSARSERTLKTAYVVKQAKDRKTSAAMNIRDDVQGMHEETMQAWPEGHVERSEKTGSKRRKSKARRISKARSSEKGRRADAQAL